MMSVVLNATKNLVRSFDFFHFFDSELLYRSLCFRRSPSVLLYSETVSARRGRPLLKTRLITL